MTVKLSDFDAVKFFFYQCKSIGKRIFFCTIIYTILYLW